MPMPLRLLLAAQPKLVTPVLQVVHHAITRFLLAQAELTAGLTAEQADSGAVTLMQRFGSAANLNIHLHCRVLDGVYRCATEGEPVFVEVPAPTDEALQTVLHKIITRLMKLLTRKGVLVEEQGQTYMADDDADSDEGRTLRPLQAAACTSTHLVMSPLEFMQRLAARATEGRPTGARATPQSPPCADDRAAGRSLAHDAPEVVTSDGLKPRAAPQSPGVPPTFVCPLRPEHRRGPRCIYDRPLSCSPISARAARAAVAA